MCSRDCVGGNGEGMKEKSKERKEKSEERRKKKTKRLRREAISDLHKLRPKEKEEKRTDMESLLVSETEWRALVQSGAQTHQNRCQVHSHSGYHQNKHVQHTRTFIRTT